MRTPYELTIPFRASKDYQRLVILLYGLGLLAVLGYAYAFWISVYLSLALLVHGRHLYNLKRFHPHDAALIFEGGCWSIKDTLGVKTAFSRLRIVYDFDYLFCLVLEREKKKRYLLFFRDQLTPEERRALYFSQLEWREPSTLFKSTEKELPE